MSSKQTPRVRVWFSGKVQTRTALHIGTGSSLNPATDAPILRGADGNPLVPGSSVKGALRSASERLLRALGERACMVFGDDAPGSGSDADHRCITTDRETRDLFLAMRQGNLEDSQARAIEARWGLGRDERRDFRRREDLQEQILKRELCRACRTWGSQFMAGQVRVPDLRIDPSTWFGATEIRDGVGLDRDTGTAAPKIKFDLEVLPAGAAFQFQLIAEPDAELAVVALAVGELLQGALPLGGRTTRGLGDIVLEDFTIEEVDLSNPLQLVSFLTGKGKGKSYRGQAATDRLEYYLQGLKEGAHHAA